MPRCKHCRQKFEVKHFNRPYCYEDECNDTYYESLKKKALKRAQTQKKAFHTDSMSKDQYRAKKIQPLINQLVRIIDKGQPCIATGNYGKMSAGHRHSVGDSRNLSLNLHNIHIQSYQSNSMKAGDHVKYRAGLIEIYSREYANFIDETLYQCPLKLWDKSDLVELRPRLQKIVNHYKKLGKEYTPKERIELRNKLNTELGIYEEKYSVFVVS